MAQTCECGAANDVDHALICKLGSFVIMRHNAVRDRHAYDRIKVMDTVESTRTSPKQDSRGSKTDSPLQTS